MTASGLEAAPILEISGVSKAYGAVEALTDVHLLIRSGEVLGLLGANGAGKSTLLSILAGTTHGTFGQLHFRGESIGVSDFGLSSSTRWGIACVRQELSLFPNLSVAENFRMFRSADAPRSLRATAAAVTDAISEVFGDCSISPRAEVGSLSVAEQQVVEIGIVATKPGLSVVIFDEPTSALSRQMARQLQEYVRRRASEGVAVIYVTHKLDEVLELCHRIVVLRDGRVVWDGNRENISRKGLLNVLGAKVTDERTGPREKADGVAAKDVTSLLEVRGVPREDGVSDPIVVRSGEVVGLAGLEGAGQRRLLRRIHGPSRGMRSIRVRTSGKSAYVTGDRQREGIFKLWGISENMLISGLPRLARLGWISTQRARELSVHWREALGIVAEHLNSPIGSLSGGNQQKVLIARGLASGASLLLLDDPTRGVDVSTKRDFYETLSLLREQGRGALLYSTEDREFAECDRVYVMAAGKVVRELKGSEISVAEIIRWSYSANEARVLRSQGAVSEP